MANRVRKHAGRNLSALNAIGITLQTGPKVRSFT